MFKTVKNYAVFEHKSIPEKILLKSLKKYIFKVMFRIFLVAKQNIYL